MEDLYRESCAFVTDSLANPSPSLRALGDHSIFISRGISQQRN